MYKYKYKYNAIQYNTIQYTRNQKASKRPVCFVSSRRSFKTFISTKFTFLIHCIFIDYFDYYFYFYIFQGPRTASGDLERCLYAQPHDARWIPSCTSVCHGSRRTLLEQRTQESNLYQVRTGRTSPKIHSEMEGESGSSKKIIVFICLFIFYFIF